jgi:hypothetical protein
MPLYKVLMRGENFLLNLTGEPDLLSFRVIHFVKAADEGEACRIASIRVRKNRDLHGALNMPENPSRLECESVKRVWWRSKGSDGRYEFWRATAPELPSSESARR